jgi:hypothetical protein
VTVIELVTMTGSKLRLDESIVEQFGAGLRGRLLHPGATDTS